MKQTVKIVGLFLVAILCISLFANLFDGGSTDEPSGPGTIVQKPPADTDVPEDPEVSEECSHVDADDDSFCDKCGESFSDGQDLFGGTVINNLTFSDNVSKDCLTGLESGTAQGYSLGGLKDGLITTESGYLQYEMRAEDVENTNSSTETIYFGISNETRQGYVSPVDVSTFDYLTIDFDVWTDTEFFPSIAFKLQGKDSDSSTTNDGSYIEIGTSSSDGNYLAKRIDGTVESFGIGNEIHLTYVICINRSNIYLSVVKVYLDGEYLTSFSSFPHSSLVYLRAYFGVGYEVPGASVNFDNFTVSTFGNGDGSYKGDLVDLSKDNSITLTECADSVLFNKNV